MEGQGQGQWRRWWAWGTGTVWWQTLQLVFGIGLASHLFLPIQPPLSQQPHLTASHSHHLIIFSLPHISFSFLS